MMMMEQKKIYVSQVISPIIAEGDAIGAVVILSKQAGENLGELELKLAETASAFLRKANGTIIFLYPQ